MEARRSSIPAQWPWPEGHDTVAPTFNTTIARSGWKHNVVPQELVLEGDRRILPEETWDNAVREVHDSVEKARARQPNLDYEVATPFYCDGWAIDPHDPFVEHMARICALSRNESTPVGGSAGSSDISHVAHRLGVPTVSHGLARPGESRYHAPNERVRLSDLTALTRIICRAALNAPPS